MTTEASGGAISLPTNLWNVVRRTYDLGFTAFGGPPVHFQIFHQRFVHDGDKLQWVDEQTYQELFSICQALPGPGSTKLLFCLALLKAGIIPAFVVFLIWSLPGAVAMYSLSLGVQKINTVLPSPVYAALSGLNAATVGIIALAAVQLSRKAITDPLTRVLVTLGGCAGVCYNALWFFPAIMVFGGAATFLWDCWLRAQWGRFIARRRQSRQDTSVTQMAPEIELAERIPAENSESTTHILRRNIGTSVISGSDPVVHAPSLQHVPNHRDSHAIPLFVGIGIIAAFFVLFAAVMIARGVIAGVPYAFQVFSNMFLAGTIIFGGGPVVVPLLREYVVQPGWVSSRDFLIGLAIIQALPGPNFNFAVYLGALAFVGSSLPTVVGALLAFLGIFAPGIVLAVGFQSVWRAIRSRPQVVSILRGINAAAVGLVFTAVYRLWEIGYLTLNEGQSVSLGQDPWWVAVTASTFVSVEWFGVPPPVAIIFGGVLGLAWWGAVGR